MSVSFETHGHEDKFWNLGPMPTGQRRSEDVQEAGWTAGTLVVCVQIRSVAFVA